ncbi:MAG: quinone-dependent dihydroorotate dehydrogenase [Sphingomonas sp.]|uniref:Dihydroorotate dehydrogenase (quinone) n=2 Tax=Sphingomonas adhaesiva TaxID=28212 RepID=A0A2A4I8V9_9SPHN|nr:MULTISPECIES: quinone-dependent dihydroorotate dehydrogenase [Sphingomonas]PCG14230.1 dihydroorotate dehydrogenase (quinone) [Sphingomonas adhaesiva]PZU76457.1 MAG: quinone-dependent dihydroorotate dehydrogenase [Sphingomonas sp.]
MPSLLQRAIHAIDPETAHVAAIRALAAWGTAGTPMAPPAPALPTRVAGIDFPNPVGLAAGLDKDARAIAGLFALGFGSVEVGTLTPRAQPGNPKPRLFRLVEDRAVINRMGFNNGGLAAGIARARAARRTGVLGINVGANKDATDRVADYVAGVTAAAPVADYITINVSSPNTPGLRDLQQGAALAELLAACMAARGATPLFLKVAPDLDAGMIDGVARAAIDARVDALVMGNTTVSRPPLSARDAGETGGLSGAPLRDLARARLADMRRATGTAVPLIAVGGIDSGAEAYARIRAGASLVQVYTALVYDGPGLPRRIVAELAALLARDGFASVAEAVGA